jgi:natural product precursor
LHNKKITDKTDNKCGKCQATDIKCEAQRKFIMKKINLADLTLDELEAKEMEHLKGGGVACSTRSCSASSNAGFSKLMGVMREKNQVKKDSIAADSLRVR